MKKKPFLLYQIIQTSLGAGAGEVVFVGVTTDDLKSRMHTHELSDGDLAEWFVDNIYKATEVERYESLDEALEAERELLFACRPRFNLTSKSRPNSRAGGRKPGSKNKGPTKTASIRVRCVPELKARLAKVMPDLSESAKVAHIVEEWFAAKELSK